jgi:hypothetical protein
MTPLVGRCGLASNPAADREVFDQRCDVYAVGCVLWEMLTARPVFDGPSGIVYYQKMRDFPVPSSHLVDGIPAILDAVVVKAMAAPAQTNRTSVMTAWWPVMLSCGSGAVATYAHTPPISSPGRSRGLGRRRGGCVVVARDAVLHFREVEGAGRAPGSSRVHGRAGKDGVGFRRPGCRRRAV